MAAQCTQVRPKAKRFDSPRSRLPSHILLGFQLAWIAGLLFQIVGCSTDSEYRELDRAEAISRLRGTVADLAPEVELLKHGVHLTKGSEYWIFATSQGPELSESVRAEGPSPCPADSVFGFAVGLGVELRRIEPLIPNSPTGPAQHDPAANDSQGKLWQWRADEFSVRLRAVRTKTGYLNIVERLAEP